EVSNDDGRLLVAAIGPTAIDSIFTLPDPFTRADVDAHEAAVVELLTGDAPIGADEREGVRDAVGDIVDVAVHGTMADGNELHTYVRVTGSRSSLELWYALDENGGVAAAEGPTVPPTATFTGGSDGEFVSADPMRRRADVTLRFEAGTVIVDTGATTSTARQDI
ncbi:MAG: hypothetical protein HZB15_03870, partial [Actinobacteria bacterium]|nr:hypothetical protein [Actinomycetota bacterium]